MALAFGVALVFAIIEFGVLINQQRLIESIRRDLIASRKREDQWRKFIERQESK